MDRSARERAVRLLDTVADRFPGALVGHPQGLALRDATGDGDWWRGPYRFVLPRPDALDHWEAGRLADPWVYLDLVAGGAFIGLQVEQPQGLERVARLMGREHAERLARFMEAAGRFEEEAETAAIRVTLGRDGRWREAVIDDRVVPTGALGRPVLEGLLRTARGLPVATSPGAAAGLRLVRVPLDEADPVALRREVKRVVALWRPLWGLPVARPRMKKDELDVRLRAAYRRSLRLIAGRMGPAERADLRVEVRTLQAACRESGLRRPRLLDVVSERLGLL